MLLNLKKGLKIITAMEEDERINKMLKEDNILKPDMNEHFL